MNGILLSFALATASVAAAASPYCIQANVLDAMTAETLPGVTYTVFAANDTLHSVAAGMTATNGELKVELPSAGNYILKLNLAGQKPLSTSFAVTEEKPVAMLGALAMQSEGEALDEVVITGRRPVIEATGDKVSYNLTEDPSTQTHTVLEMLRKVPMVTVDAQDNIMINGQSNFKIYLNGKEDPMLSQNASTILKSLPASAIKRIEVIMDPGAKYDAEGVGGILNIITETQASTDGQMATLQLGAGPYNGNASVYGIMKHNKVTASVDVSYYRNFGNRTNDASIIRKNFSAENPSTIDQESKMSNSNSFLQGDVHLSWEPNEKNLFTASASGYGGWGRQNFDGTSDIYGKGSALLSHTASRNRGKWSWGSVTANTGYQHNFNAEGHNIILSYQYVHGLHKNKQYNTTLESNEPGYVPCMYDYTNSPTNEHTVQLDYTNPISKYFTLEAGAKGIFRRNSSDGYTMNGPDWDNLVMAEHNDVDLKQNQDVAAGYASYSGTFGKFGLKAGLRYEYTRMSVKFKTPGYDNFSTNLNDWVPNASISYSFTPMQNLYASYQQRIRRPGVDELNPHESEYINDFFLRGNPDLTSEKSHIVALSYSNFSGKLGINLRTSYSFSNNRIATLQTVEGDKFFFTYANVGSQKDWDINAFVKYQINGLMDVSGNVGLRYTNLRYKTQNMGNHGWNLSFNANYNYSMPWNMKLNAYAGFFTKRYELQGTQGGFDYHGISITKAFFQGDKLKITLSGNNFAHPTVKGKMDIYGADFRNTMRMNVAVWSVQLSVGITLGSLQTNVSRVAKQIENDDVQQSQGGGSMGGMNN